MPIRQKQHFRPPALPAVAVGGFWLPWIEAIRAHTADALYDRVVAAGTFEQVDIDRPVPELRIPLENWQTTPQVFWDSDLGKTIEVYANLLATKRDAAMEEKVDGMVVLLKKLQQPDGYCNSWFTRMRPGERWTNVRDMHEMYNAGHMLEGAVAYYQATGKRDFLDVMERFLDHIRSVFGPDDGKKRGYPGHEELELALMRLYRLTGDGKHLELAKFFIDERGTQPHFFELEARERGETINRGPSQTHEYNQSHKPVREQDKVVGHAVRAMYLYSGMADVAVETEDDGLRQALDRLWDDLHSKRLYLHGGMGPSKDNEGFTSDYDLPNASAYAETCAAIGLAFWARRMLGFGPNARYADSMELALYNGALSGMSLDGTKFFYENPLESNGNHNRWTWHRCPCCPPNLARAISSIGTYIYDSSENGVAVNLYCKSKGDFSVAGTRVTVEQETDYPWNGEVCIRIGAENASTFTLSTRIPSWSGGITAILNGQPVDVPANSVDGYLVVTREWKDGDNLKLDIPLEPRIIWPNPEIPQDAGRAALARGPLIYCLEGMDNAFSLNRVRLDPSVPILCERKPDLLGGVTVLKMRARIAESEDWGGELYRTKPPTFRETEIVAVPYYAWDNRQPDEMLVWIPVDFPQ